MSDVRDVLREYGWACGPEFDERYLTDTWVFNLANVVERERIQAERFKEALSETASLLYQVWRCNTDEERSEHGVAVAAAVEKFANHPSKIKLDVSAGSGEADA